MIFSCPGGLPAPKDLGKLVRLDNVRKTIGNQVTERQKDEIIKDLEAAVKEFTIREENSFAATHTLPFVRVNNRTNMVATHSRLLFSLQVSLLKSLERLRIPLNTGAFDKVSRRT